MEPVFYVQFSATSVGKYEGMSQDVVENLLANLGRSYSFITKQEYEAKLPQD